MLLSDLVANLSNPDKKLRVEAVSQLILTGKYCTPQIIPLLQSNNIDAISSSLKVLKELKDLKAVNPIIELLDHPSYSIRRQASGTLKNYGDNIEKILVKKLSQRKTQQKKEILAILPFLESLRNPKSVIPCLTDSDPDVRVNAARAIGLLNIKKGVQPLLRSLIDIDWRVRQWSAFSLGLIGQKKGVIEPLIQALSDENSHVQTAVVTALGDIGSRDAIEPLLGLLDTTDDILLNAVIRSLGYCKAKVSTERLLTLFDKGDKYTRSAIVFAFGRIGGSKVYKILEDALNDKEIAVMAIYSLHKIGTKKAIKLLKKHRNSDNPLVKREISWVLSM